ncbi:DUF6220 domain-containing protein [Frigidibacter mobilis]|uniref:DoxX-like protein n=1 Tax=Frigidibacter mobilis TaxID=1335048 RepID=A0A165SIC7_9RHOB|nr:DUF6220 domain-containing protein [Frigidibacter mobilis]AMY68369.1 hypothetical protein AKL17_1113 [Frigidibacter mobilis]
MKQTHGTLTDLGRGTPGWFTLSARALPLGLLAQFLSAGSALFHDGTLWELHGAVGGALSLPVFALLGGAMLHRRLNGFGWWAGLATLLYLTQIALAAGAAPLLVLHPLNGALLLTTSLILLAKVEHRRASARP